MGPDTRPVALITGASRRGGIAAAIAQSLAEDGWNVALTYWHAYDARVHAASDPADVAWLRARMEACDAKTAAVEADLSLVESAAAIFDAVERALGGVIALVLCHTEGVDSDLLTTTVESFDRHFAVNARGSWLLVREHGCATGVARVADGSSRSPAITSSGTCRTAPARAR